MTSRRRGRGRTLFGAVLVLAAVIAAGRALAPDRRDNSARAVPPQVLNRIATKNDDAALAAAAELRARSARTARAADARQDERDHANAAR